MVYPPHPSNDKLLKVALEKMEFQSFKAFPVDNTYFASLFSRTASM